MRDDLTALWAALNVLDQTIASLALTRQQHVALQQAYERVARTAKALDAQPDTDTDTVTDTDTDTDNASHEKGR